jgi:oligoendopeptidase F
MSDMMKTVLTRAEIDKKYKWNEEVLFASPQEWEAAAQSFQEDIPQLAQFQGRLHESAAVLADAWELFDSMNLRLGKLWTYVSMAASVDVRDQKMQSFQGRVGALFGMYAATISYGEPEMLAIGQAKLTEWIAQEPRLSHLAHMIDDLFRRQAHVRSAEVEEVLGLSAETMQAISMTADMLTDADMTFADYSDAHGATYKLVQSNLEATKHVADREIRRTAWENYADSYLAHKNSLAANLSTSVKATVFQARVRRYSSALEASLFENNIPTTVYHNLINTFKKNIPTWHKYWQVRRKALGVDTLHPYDIWAPLTDKKPHFSYEDAIHQISTGMQPLGSDYVNVLMKGCLEDRWVDVYPNQGKRQGAFSTGWKGTLPYIMTSFVGDFESLSTLAHELGHSMHSYYTRHTQPVAYADYTMFAAETASNFNQAMVRAYFLKNNPDRDFQISVIEEAMYNFHRYFFIMPTLARFELEFYTRVEQGDTPTADDLNNLMADLFEEGYGGHMHVDRERVGVTWAQFTHLYAPFYVFNYATGISAANSLCRRILDGTAGSQEAYLSFLKSGSSLYPVEALRRAGADMETPEPVERTFAILGEMVDRLETLIS